MHTAALSGVSLVLMEPALRVRAGGPASQDLTRRMARGFQRYQAGDLEGAVDGFIGAASGADSRQVVERALPGSWPQALRDAQTFFVSRDIACWHHNRTMAKPLWWTDQGTILPA